MKAKDLNNETYSFDICFKDMLDIRYRGLRLVPSRSATRELFKYGMALDDCKEILEQGYASAKRRKGVIEKSLRKGSKIFTVSIAESHNITLKEDIYLIIHIGRTSK